MENENSNKNTETLKLNETTVSETVVSESSDSNEEISSNGEISSNEEISSKTDEIGNADENKIVDSDVVAIPYINDGEQNIQLFYNSIFIKTGNSDFESAVFSAEKYFFEKFANDDEPKWDGVFVCMYDFAKNMILKDDRNVFVKKRDFFKNWLLKKTGSMENVTFNVKCTMPKVWASHFQSFLRRMEEYGEKNHSGQIAFFSDGAGNYKPKFKFTSEFDKIDGCLKPYIMDKADELFDAC